MRKRRVPLGSRTHERIVADGREKLLRERERGVKILEREIREDLAGRYRPQFERSGVLGRWLLRARISREARREAVRRSAPEEGYYFKA